MVEMYPDGGDGLHCAVCCNYGCVRRASFRPGSGGIGAARRELPDLAGDPVDILCSASADVVFPCGGRFLGLRRLADRRPCGQGPFVTRERDALTRTSEPETWVERISSGAVDPASSLCRTRRLEMSQAPPAMRTAETTQASCVVPRPTYFKPEARITRVMTGRRCRSGTREESREPIRTAGTLPTMIELVRPNSTCPKVSAPRAAAAVSGMACARSVPTSWFAASAGYKNMSRTIISEPAPT